MCQVPTPLARIRIIMDSYYEYLISELKPTLNKVAVSGTLITKNESSLVIDDGTGQVVILTNELFVPSGTYLRVFGRVIPFDEGVQVHADVIQDLSTIDKIAHKKVKEMMRTS